MKQTRARVIGHTRMGQPKPTINALKVGIMNMDKHGQFCLFIIYFFLEIFKNKQQLKIEGHYEECTIIALQNTKAYDSG